MSISSYPQGFRGGAAIKNVPLHDQIDGRVYWVDSGVGKQGNPGDFTSPLATVQQGIDKATADNNDIVFVAPGHAEAITAQIDFNKAGVQVIGLGEGNLRPTLTPDGAIDCIDVSAANMTLANFIFQIPGTDSQTADVNVDAAYFRLINTRHHGSTGGLNKLSFVTVTALGDNLLIDGMRAFNDTVEMTNGIELAAADSVEIKNSVITSSAVGYANAPIDDTGVATNLWVHHVQLKNIQATGEAIDLAGNSVGMIHDAYCSGRNGTIASNIITGNGAFFAETYVTEDAAVSGLLIPTIDS